MIPEESRSLICETCLSAKYSQWQRDLRFPAEPSTCVRNTNCRRKTKKSIATCKLHLYPIARNGREAYACFALPIRKNCHGARVGLMPNNLDALNEYFQSQQIDSYKPPVQITDCCSFELSPCLIDFQWGLFWTYTEIIISLSLFDNEHGINIRQRRHWAMLLEYWAKPLRILAYFQPKKEAANMAMH